MCPKCKGPTVEKPLFTSIYQHCVKCDDPAKPQAVETNADGAPFAVGDTVYPLSGPMRARAMIVERMMKRRIRKLSGEESEEWLMRLKERVGWRECSRYTKNPMTSTADVA